MAGLSKITLGNFTHVYYGDKDAVETALLKLGDVQSVGDISDEATIVDVNAYGQKYLQKLVGSANAAAIEIVCNYDPSDAGQSALIAAYTNTTTMEIAIVMSEDDTSPTTGDGTFVKFPALVASSSISNSFDETRTVTFSIVPENGFPNGYEELPFA